MPNIEVKPIGAESTWLEAAWKDRTLLNKETHHRDVMSFFSVLSYQVAKRFIVRVIGHFVCFLMPMELVFIELHWHLFFLR